MSSIIVAGDVSGTVTLDAPAVAGTTVLTLPATSGTLNTSGAVNEVPAGTAPAPAITTTGDTNTGIFFPAADTIAFTEGGVEAMRINSSGNVGIGTDNPTAKLVVAGKGLLGTDSTNPIVFTGSGGVNAGIGSYNADTDMNIFAAGTGNIKFVNGVAWNSTGTLTTVGPVVMRIKGDGEVQIAGTTDRGAFNLQCNGTGVWGAGAYTNGSDARIKDDITPLDSGLDVVEKLNPVTYKYKEDWSKDQSIQTGFIAQDLLVALEGKEYVDGIVNQSSEYMSVAYQNIIPILTKAIQELNAKVEAQAEQIKALQGAA
jgi:hypothetical protein